jgi:hypothetical protein
VNENLSLLLRGSIRRLHFHNHDRHPDENISSVWNPLLLPDCVEAMGFMQLHFPAFSGKAWSIDFGAIIADSRGTRLRVHRFPIRVHAFLGSKT